MKSFICLTLLTIFSFQLSAQNLPEPYQLDGNLSILEYRDTTALKSVINEPNLIIKEHTDYYYIGIRSNTQTIANAYYKSSTELKVMHASAALGETNYIKEETGWVKDRPEWEWRYRDSNYWDELHENPITDFESYYREFGWVGNTVSLGSYREMEMIISKEIVKDIDNLFITYTKHNSEQRTTLKLWSIDDKELASDRSINIRLHTGDLPEKLNF